MQFQHARCDERRGSFHVVRVISNLLFRPIHHYNSPACAETFLNYGGDIFTCSISRGVAETYSRKRVYNCSYADSKFETFMSGIFTTVCYFIVRSLFLLFFSTRFSFSLSPSLFFRSLYPSFYQAALFLIPHERSCVAGAPSSIENSYEVGVAVTWLLRTRKEAFGT